MRTRLATRDIAMLMIMTTTKVYRDQIQLAVPDASFSLHRIRKLPHANG